MIHPSALLRNDSVHVRTFSAPISNDSYLDCGIKTLPCLNKCLNLERLAKPSVFIGLLSAVAFLQGLILQYFRGTSKYWSKHYNISQDHIEWIIYTNEFLVGIFALLVAYWGNRIHRASWIGGLTIYHSVASLLLIIPELHRKKDNNAVETENLCKVFNKTETNDEIDFIALALVGIFQIFTSIAYISLMSHGITYLDDNVVSRHSPTHIGIVLGSKEIGTQAGIYAAGLPSLIDIDKIFVSPAWITITVVAFLIGVFIAMFPQSLPQALVRRLAASLVDLASGLESANKNSQPIDGFFKTLFRLIKNKFLIINILVNVILQSAVINFNTFEKFYNQSRFFISERETSVTQLIMNLLKQPLVAISLIVTGLVVSRSKFTPKSLVKWNMIVSVIVVMLFASTAFLKCEHSSLVQDRTGPFLTETVCAPSCDCSRDFQPICINEKTFYSPCIAGCTIKNDDMTYSCTCGGFKSTISKTVGKEGACKAQNCFLYWVLAQANRVFTTAFLASTLLTNLIINMRCINPKDKALALGLEATLLGLVPYLPVKLAYEAVADKMCKYYNGSKGPCYGYTENFGLFISLSTIVLILISFLLSIVLLFINVPKHYDSENEEDDDDDDDDGHEMRDIGYDEPDENGALMSEHGNNERLDLHEQTVAIMQSNPDSLADLENVGDDHDSVDFKDEEEINHRDRTKKHVVLESSF